MIISHKKKFILLMVPKCASMSMRMSLNDINDEKNLPKKHNGRLKHHANVNLIDFNYSDYFVAAFVRNPFDRIVSSYNHLVRTSKFNLTDVGFEEFINRWPDRHPRQYGLFFKSSHHWAKNATKVYRFENLHNEFDKMCKDAGIGNIELLKSENKHEIDLESYYNEDLIKRVMRIFKDDVDNYEYRY